MKNKPFISSSIVHALLKYAEVIGITPAEVCARANFPAESIFDPENHIHVRQFLALWIDIARQAGDSAFGLHFVEKTRAQPGGDVLSAILFNCPTVGNAMEKLARYHGLTTDLIQVKIEHQGDFTHYAWEPSPENTPIDRQISEAVICRLFYTLQDLSHGKISVTEIHFRHSQPAQIVEHGRIFNAPLKFNQPRNQLIIHQKELALPIPLANPTLLKRLDTIADDMLKVLYPPDTWSEKVSRWISKLLRQGEKPAIEKIARELAVSTRLLQNKLNEEGSTYRVLLDQVRKEMAMAYLKEPNINLYDTAFLLGFSDQSSFTHAFKRWTGSTPTAYREVIQK